MAHERVLLKNHARLERALAVVEKHEFLRDQRGDVRMAVPVEIVHRGAECARDDEPAFAELLRKLAFAAVAVLG